MACTQWARAARAGRCVAGAFLWCAALSACGSAGSGLDEDDGSGAGSSPTSSSTPTQGATAAGAGAGAPSGASAPSGSALPCEVAAIVGTRCHACHGAVTQAGARMSLLTVEDFLAPSPSDASTPVHVMAARRLHDAQRPMPPLPFTLEPAELSALDAWLAAGAPAGTEGTCPSGEPASPGEPTGGAAGSPATGQAPGEAEPQVGLGQPAPGEEVECFNFHAHAGDGTTPFTVPTTPDYYHCWDFTVPHDAEHQAIAVRTRLDNTRVVHHTLLFLNDGPPGNTAGYACSGAHPNSKSIHGWAPGASQLELPQDIGFALSPGQSYTLELHYNAPEAGLQDATGEEVCWVKSKREHTAAMAQLGTDVILFTTKATGLCSPTLTEPVHVFGVAPHMHVAGTRMEAIINRADGSTEVLHDAPFAFDSQMGYEKDVWLMPGDTITTNCYYSKPSVFGAGTNDEMCYLWTSYYPAGQLSSNANGGSLANSAYSCM